MLSRNNLKAGRLQSAFDLCDSFIMSRHDTDIKRGRRISGPFSRDREKYGERRSHGSPGSTVVLAADVAAAFPDSESVNRALRLLMKAASAAQRRPRRTSEAPVSGTRRRDGARRGVRGEIREERGSEEKSYGHRKRFHHREHKNRD